jgi:adenylate cyclase
MRPWLRKIGEAWARVADLVGKAPARRIDMGIAIVVTLAALALYADVITGWQTNSALTLLENVEVRTLDARFRTRGVRPIDDRIIIVGLDEKTLQRVGSFPIARNYYAQALDNVAAGGARVIGFDFDFPTPEKNSAIEALQKLETQFASSSPAVVEKIREIEKTSDNDAILAASVKKAGNVVLGHIFLPKDRAREIDAKTAQDYLYVLSDHPFPQVRTEKGGQSFDLGKAWNDPALGREGPVMYGIEPNLRLLAEAAKSYGFFNYNPDPDGIYRHALSLIRYHQEDCANAPIGECQWYPSLPLEMLRIAEDIKEQSIVANMSDTGMVNIELGPYTFPTEPDGSFLINFAGPYKTYPHCSMADVIDAKEPCAPSRFAGKIVLMGPTAIGIGDIRPTPFQSSDFMGVELHANVLDNMLNSGKPGRGFLKRGAAESTIDVVFILLFGLGMGFLFARLKPLQSTFSMLAAVAAFVGICYFAFSHWGMWLYMVIPAGTLVVNYGAITSFRMVFEEREKRKVRRTFERYVSPGVIRLIEQDPKKYFKAGGESKELSIMFSDIRSFTTISEGLTPDDLVYLLNEYLGEMTDIVFSHWGTLDKYIGDALMAFWGSPFPQEDHAFRACAAAINMSKRLEELNLKWELEKRKPLEIGIGINTGVVSVGNMGSSRRFAWTVMGDPVNVASRLEGQNKEYHTARIIGESTYAKVQREFVCRDLDRIRVKGKLKPVKIYELLDFGKEASKYRDLLAQWDLATEAYYRQAWDESIQKFEALLSRYPDDGPSHTFLKRSHEKRAETPDTSWDGVFVAKSK